MRKRKRGPTFTGGFWALLLLFVVAGGMIWAAISLTQGPLP